MNLEKKFYTGDSYSYKIYSMSKMHYVDFHQKWKNFIDWFFFIFIPKQTK